MSPNYGQNSHSTEKSINGWTTKRVALSALFVAAAIATSFISIPIFPAAPYLKYDPSGIFALLAALTWGTSSGCIVVALPWLLRAFTDPIGAVMSLVIGISGVICASVIYKRNSNKTGLIVALCASAILSIIVAIIMNIIMTPIYSGVSVDTVVKMIVPILLPFNILKFAINSIMTALLIKPLKNVL